MILKTLGATRLRLLTAYAIEYLLIGTATAIFGVIGGSLAAWLIVAQLMHLSFTWLPAPALAAALAAVAVTVTLGLTGTLCGSWPETRANIEKFIGFATFRHGLSAPARHGISGIMGLPDG